MKARRLIWPSLVWGLVVLIGLVAGRLITYSAFFLTQPLAQPVTQPGAQPLVLAQQTPETNPTTLRWFLRWDEARIQTIALPLIAAFEAQNPTIQVELQNSSREREYYRTLNIALEQGNAPDVFYLSTQIAYELALQDRLLPLDDWVATDPLALDAFDPATLTLYRNPAQGLYCLPVDTATLAVFYNKALFDAAEVAYPQTPWQWTDFLATAQQLTHDGDGDGTANQAGDYYGIDRFDAYWPLVVWTATGQNVFDDPYAPTKFLLEDEKAIDALQWLADLSLVHGVMPGVADEDEPAADMPVNRFLAGQAAMQITGQWNIPAYVAAADFPFDFVELPSGDVAANRSDGHCFAIARNTPQPAAAWTFVKFLAGPGGLGAHLLTATQPISPTLRNLQQSAALPTPDSLPEDRLDAFLPQSALRFALTDPLHPIYHRWEAVATTELGALWAGTQRAEEAVENMAEEADELLRNLAAPAAMGQQKIFTSSLAAALDSALPRTYYVAPTGDDRDDGATAATALATLQRALDQVQPGDTIQLQPGDYYENVVSVTAGRDDAPITIIGPTDAVLHGKGEASAAFYLTHDYYTLVGFTMDGLYGDPAQKAGYTDKLLYVQGQHEQRGVTGLRVLHMTFQRAGGECLRLRYFAQHNEIAYSTFLACGLFDFEFADGGKNGEAIYIGTSSTQWADGKNPTPDPDQSNENWIHHNVMNTQGNECVEIKEGASHNLIEHNRCTGQLDPDAAGIGARGSHNVIRYNRIYGNVGAGIRLGGHTVDDVQYGVGNEVYGNTIWQNVAGGVNIAIEPQAKICENNVEHNLGKATFGDGSAAYVPTEPCS